jgi:hypothetical protein
MLRVVISAVTEFMVRVLHLRMLLRIHDAAGVKPCHACDSIACISGVPFSDMFYLISVKTLKAPIASTSHNTLTMNSATALMTSQNAEGTNCFNATGNTIDAWALFRSCLAMGAAVTFGISPMLATDGGTMLYIRQDFCELFRAVGIHDVTGVVGVEARL